MVKTLTLAEKEGDKRKGSRLELLHAFALVLNSSRDIGYIIHYSAKMITEMTASEGCHILFAQNIKNSLKLETAAFYSGKPFPPDVDETQGISGTTFETGKTLIIADAEKDPRVNPKMIEWFRHKSMLSVPIIVREAIVGVIVVYSRILNYYTEEDSHFMMMLGAHLGLAVENAQLVLELNRAATLDPLTGAYNHRYFRNKLEETVREQPDQYVSLVMLDINNFKDINDHFGHLSGDYILQEITLLVKKILNDNIILARYGGDEFAMILPDISSQEALKIGSAIENTISAYPFVYNHKKINVSISWGFITCRGKNVKNVNSMIDSADKRLYHMKKATRKTQAK